MCLPFSREEGVCWHTCITLKTLLSMLTFLPCCSLFFSFSGRLFHFGVKYPVISDFIYISCVPFPFVFLFVVVFLNFSAEQL